MFFSLHACEYTNNTRIFKHALPRDLVRRADDISSCMHIDDGPPLCCPLKASCTYKGRFRTIPHLGVMCVDCAGNGRFLLHRPSLPATGVFTSLVRRQETDYSEHFGIPRFASLHIGAAS
jgi:hypothetical protein